MQIGRKKTIRNRRITVGDIRISYLIKEGNSQSAAPIIFIHGFPFNKNMWINQLESLPEERTGIAIDVRGHGQSTMGHGFFSIDLFAKDLIEFMRKMELKNAIICGVSMGGYIALRAHEFASDKFTALILSDTNSVSDNNEGKAKRFETIKTVLQHGNRTFAINFTSKVFSKRSLAHRQEEVELIKSSIRRNNIRSICATLLALAARTDTTEHLKNIHVPTLLTWGTDDELTPIAQAEHLLEHLPNARLVEFDQCGHLPSLENPERFNEVMLEFLKENG